MKKLTILFVTLVIILASCEKREVITKIDPILISESGIVALINPGNTSCEELPGTYVASSGKVDYVAGKFVFEGSQTDWPFGLTVTVSADGRYIGFELPANSQYCVGAVIAKGGNASNVYTYDTGIKSDQGLSSPINSSGNPAALSNLTFCFVECKPIVVAVKFLYTAGSDFQVFPGEYAFGASSGSIYPFVSQTGTWCEILGINYYPTTNTFPIIREPSESYPGIHETVGTATLWEEGSNLKVQVDIKAGGVLDKTSIYVGDYSGLYGSGTCPNYNIAPWLVDETDGSSVTFTVPL